MYFCVYLVFQWGDIVKKNVKSGVKEVLKGGSEKNVESVGHIGW